MHFLNLTLEIRLKEMALYYSMKMVLSNEKNNIIYSNSMSERMRNVQPHARLSGNKIILTILYDTKYL